MPAIDIHGLCYAFGTGELRKQVLVDVQLSVAAVSLTILSGPSGCGKTTLLTLTGGLRSPQEGRITVLGHDLHSAGPDELVAVRRHIGFVFQLHNLLDFLTAQQNVEMSLQLHPELTRADRRVRAAAILDTVGLAERRDYYPAALSGGQRQRVSIARALAANPSLILADEPTAALDSTSGRQVVELLQQLSREQGAAVLMVTHDNRILDLADRIVHMEDGRILD